ncbi:hypothetical protein ACWDA9_00620 [Streptomyces sp. NPDC001193]
MKQLTTEKAFLIADQIRQKAGQAAQLVRDKTPEPVLDKTAHTAAQVWGSATRVGQYAAGKASDPVLEKAGKAAAVARGNRAPLLVAGAAIIAFALVRRGRGRRR